MAGEGHQNSKRRKRRNALFIYSVVYQRLLKNKIRNKSQIRDALEKQKEKEESRVQTKEAGSALDLLVPNTRKTTKEGKRKTEYKKK